MTKAEEISKKEITIIESSLQPDMQQMIRRSDALRAVEEAINYTHCCKSDSELLFDFLEWFNNYCTVDTKPNKEDVELYLSK